MSFELGAFFSFVPSYGCVFIAYLTVYALHKDGLYYPFYFRLLERLKRKDPLQIKLEQLERGFSLYLNGANSERRNYRRKIKSHSCLKNETETTRTNGELHESFPEILNIYSIRAVVQLVRLLVRL